MKNRKLIFINLSVLALLFGGFFTSLFVYDLFFSKSTSKAFKKNYKYTSEDQIFKKSEFPEDITVTYYPDFGFNFFGLDKNIFPINGRSNMRTFYCEEQGFLAEYTSDRHGFRNPDSVFDNKKLDIALVGDSFIDGACTNESTISKNLTNLTDNKLSIANFALGGSGPLLQLAFMKEFGKHYHPKQVFWFWAINDLRNLQDELHSPLRKYMVSGFTQDLYIKDNKEIADNIVKDHLYWFKSKINFDQTSSKYDKKVALSMRFPNTYKFYKKVKRIIPQLYFDTPSYWQKKTIISREEILSRKIPPKEFRLMDQVVFDVMNEVDNLVKSWGGEMIILYMGGGGFNTRPNRAETYIEQNKFQRDLIKKISKANKIKFFDLDEEIDKIFTPSDHIKGFSRGRGHFTDDGYRKVSEIIYTNLLNDKKQTTSVK